MRLIADILMLGGLAAATVFLAVLAQRLKRLAQLDTGMGAAIVGLSRQVDELEATLARMRAAAQDSATDLVAATTRAEAAQRRLEILLSVLPAEVAADAPRCGMPSTPAPAAMPATAAAAAPGTVAKTATETGA